MKSVSFRNLTLFFFLSMPAFILAQQEEDNEPAIARGGYQQDLYAGGTSDSMEIAISTGDSVMAEKLLKRGYKTDAYTAYYFKPLINAAALNRYTIAAMLLDHGWDVNDTTSFDKTTALHEAIINENGPLADLLLLNGANTEVKDYKGSTPLMYAAGYGQAELVDMLLYYGAQTSPKDPQGNDALMIATYTGDEEVISLLLKHGADPNATDKNGFTPLMVAAQFGDTISVHALLEAGASPDLANRFGCNSLFVALRSRQFGMVPLLIQGGAKLNNTYGLGHKPRDYVRRNTSLDSLMHSKGAKRSLMPQFTRIYNGYRAGFNAHDWMNGLTIGAIDQRFGLQAEAGFSMRFWPMNVLEQDTGNLFWQWKEQRYLVSLYLSRDFILHHKNNKEFGIYAEAGMGYTWGKYTGTTSTPFGNYLLLPAAGITYRPGNWTFRLGYAWQDYQIPDFPKGRGVFSIAYRWNTLGKKTFTKKM